MPSHGAVIPQQQWFVQLQSRATLQRSDSFTYKANDGAADSGVATVTITVHAVNNAPAALDDNYTMVEDTTLTVSAPGVLGNDSGLGWRPAERGAGERSEPRDAPSERRWFFPLQPRANNGPVPARSGIGFKYQITRPAGVVSVPDNRDLTVAMPLSAAPVAAL